MWRKVLVSAAGSDDSDTVMGEIESIEENGKVSLSRFALPGSNRKGLPLKKDR